MTFQLPGLHDFLAGGGDMGARIAAFDWNRTPLGPIAGWPQSLRTTLSIVLNTKFPTYLAWGGDFIGFYNDAYAPLLGKKEALGIPFRDTWAETWHVVGPIAERALAGEGSYFKDFPLVLERFGYPEQTYYTFSYSPIRDESGGVGGVLCTVVETTLSVLAKRRQKFQLDLADELRGLSEPDDIIQRTCRLLGQHMDVLRVGYSDIDLRTASLFVQQCWTDGSVKSATGQRFRFEVFGPEVFAQLQRGRTVRIDDVYADERCAGFADIYRMLGVRAMLFIPLMRHGELISVLSIGTAASRRWTDEDATLGEDTAERTRSAVERAIAELALTRQLAMERDRLRLLFHQAPGFMAVLRGPAHVFELANAAYQKLVGGRDLIGKAVRDALPEASGQGFFEKLDQVYASGKPFSAADAPLLIQDRAGAAPAQHYVDFVYQPVVEADGAVSGIFVEGYDVTERKLASDALHEADRRKDEFLAMLAHELRNPLAPISAASELIELGVLDGGRLEQTGAIISRQVRHLTGLLDDLLDVSRVTRGLIVLSKAPQDLKAIVSLAIEQARLAIDARGHRLDIELPAEDVFVAGDQKRLVQILTNLLNNSARYTADGGHIAIRLSTTGTQAVLEVVDDGIGIAAEFQPHVFELFTQARRSPDRSQGGLGLGLALVKNLVELHGGNVACESKGIGAGTRFTVRLPRSDGEDASLRERDAGTSSGQCFRPLRLMIVDDNVDAAQTLAAYLESIGHAIVVEHDPVKALERARLGDLHAALLDIGMPVLDGNELARRLRRQPETARLRLIALTGYGQEHDRSTAMAAGFDHYFVKPVDLRMLARILDPQAETTACGQRRHVTDEDGAVPA